MWRVRMSPWLPRMAPTTGMAAFTAARDSWSTPREGLLPLASTPTTGGHEEAFFFRPGRAWLLMPPGVVTTSPERGGEYPGLPFPMIVGAG